MNIQGTLKAQFGKLKHLYECEIRKWWEATSLQNYIEVQRIPRGLRIYTIPAYENPDPKLLDEWAAYTTEMSVGMLKILFKSHGVTGTNA